MPGAIRKLYGEIFLKDKASKDVRKLNDSMEKTKSSMLSMSKVAGAAAAVAFGVLAHASFEAAKELELQSVRLEALAGEKYPKLLDVMNKTIEASEGLTATGDMSTAINQALKMGTSVEALSGSMGNLQKLSEITGDDLAMTMQRMARTISTGSTRFLEQNPILAKNIGKFKELGTAYDEATKKKRELFIVEMLQKSQLKIQKQYNKIVATTAGQLKIISTQWGNVKETIGGLIIKALKPLIEIGAKVFRFLGETEQGIAIVKIAFIALAIAIGTILVGSLWAAVTASSVLLATLLPFIAIGLAVVAALTAVYLIVEDIVTAFQGGESLAGDFFKWFMSIMKIIPQKILWLYNYVVNLFYRFLNFLGNVGMEIIRALIPIDFFESLIENIIDTFKNLPGKIWKSIKGLASSVYKWFSGDDTVKKPEGRAKGGMVHSGTSYVVGEQGPELFTPGASGFITPSGKSGNRISIKNLVGSIQITVQNATEGADEIKDIILDALNDLSENILPAESGLAII